MKVAIAQLNPLVGDLQGNGEHILKACLKANKLKAELILTPELSLWGYPPKDLLLNQALLEKQDEILNHLADFLAQKAPGISLIVGIAEKIADSNIPQLFNSLVLIRNNEWHVITRKQLLPTYDVFDEKRYFRASNHSESLELLAGGKLYRLGMTICEDLWVEEISPSKRIIGPDPISALIPHNIDFLINLSASPFSQAKEVIRYKLASKAAQKLNCPVVYVNQVGGNDELIFDGGSFVVDKSGHPILKLSNFKEELSIWDTEIYEPRNPISSSSSIKEQVFEALVLGVKDYAQKCGFNSATLGLSGGIDSALVAIIAAAALGPSNVTAVLMPSPWSSVGSIQDAKNLSHRLQINSILLPITQLMESYNVALTVPLGKAPDGITAENLQSRIRGTLLMAIANQDGHLLLATGNKSELAVGYCTLYGDMNGGLSVIGDIYKTFVYELSQWIDSEESKKFRERMNLPISSELIGKEILEKPPSAELRPDQLDSDSLPDYGVLDIILKGLIEERKTSEQLIQRGHEEAVVNKIKALLQKSEFKRRQAPPLLKVSFQAFGSGWRIPIASTN